MLQSVCGKHAAFVMISSSVLLKSLAYCRFPFNLRRFIVWTLFFLCVGALVCLVAVEKADFKWEVVSSKGCLINIKQKFLLPVGLLNWVISCYVSGCRKCLSSVGCQPLNAWSYKKCSGESFGITICLLLIRNSCEELQSREAANGFEELTYEACAFVCLNAGGYLYDMIHSL